VNWSEFGEANYNHDASWDWQRVQVSLQSLAGRTVRLRFHTSDSGHAPDVEIYLDPDHPGRHARAVSLETTLPHLRAVDLTWTATPLGAAFQRMKSIAPRMPMCPSPTPASACLPIRA